jgi:hypothetical protein
LPHRQGIFPAAAYFPKAFNKKPRVGGGVKMLKIYAVRYPAAFMHPIGRTPVRHCLIDQLLLKCCCICNGFVISVLRRKTMCFLLNHKFFSLFCHCYVGAYGLTEPDGGNTKKRFTFYRFFAA